MEDGANTQVEDAVRPMVTKCCKGCGEDHLRKDCVHKHSYCFKCGQKGHISPVCPYLIIKDAYGRDQSRFKQTEGRVSLEIKSDRT